MTQTTRRSFLHQTTLAAAAASVGAGCATTPSAKHLAKRGPVIISTWGFGKPAHFGLNRAAGIWMQGGGRSLLARGPEDVLGLGMAACDAYKGGLGAAAKVTCPTFLVCGNRDQMTPPKAAAPLSAAIAGAQTVVIDGAGHMMMVEKPDETLDALIAAL